MSYDVPGIHFTSHLLLFAAQFLLQEKECQESDSKGVLVVVEALVDLDDERQRLHDALEAETIKASILRHKLLNVPLDTEKEIQRMLFKISILD